MTLAADTPTTDGRSEIEHVDVCIVGSGFSGMAMAVHLFRAGMRDVLILEKGNDVGGTWRDNAYPGCACDVPSHLYSFSFALNPDWSSTYSPQPEIQAYLRKVAREQGLYPHVRLNCAMQSAEHDGELWHVRTPQGPLTARVLIAAPGPLSAPKLPELPGMDRFQGTIYHSARWNHQHDLSGERVAVVGTGASAIQFVPQIQPKVAQLHLFQRTPPWVMPRTARPVTSVEKALYRRVPALQKLMRGGVWAAREGLAVPMLHPVFSRALRAAGLNHIRRSIKDPELRRKVTPSYLPGCKRILVSNDYLPALDRPNVEVLTTGVAELREQSIVGTDGTEREVDTVIMGTGFHVTDMPLAQHIRNAQGTTLAETFRGSPAAYKSTTLAGYPNLFWLLGPNTGLGHSSVVYMAEVQAKYVVEALRTMRARGLATVAPRKEDQDAWNRKLDREMEGTVWTSGGCTSWYLDETGRNSTLYPGHTFTFAHELRTFDLDAYETTTSAPAAAAAAA